MGKRIVVSPCFNELHFLKRRIPNVCEYLQPDYCILADGMFPRGPENRTQGGDLDTIIKNYTLEGKGKLSFDFKELKQFLNECSKKYPNTKFVLLPMDYDKGVNHEQAYYVTYNIFKKILTPSPDDLIFPLECDVFLTETQAQELLSQCESLEPNHSLMSNYYQFFESPKVAMTTQRYRRLAYRYGNGSVWGCYKQFGSSHDSGIRAFHYEWIRPNRYFELRLLQLSRGYTSVLRELRSIIRSKPDNLGKSLVAATAKLGPKQRDLGLIVSPLQLSEHPLHFQTHENFEYYNE